MIQKKTTIVWNPSRKCVWNCAFCCLNAITETSNKKTQILESELSLVEKKQFIDQLDADGFCLDFGGGEILLNPDHLDLILYASEKLGPKNVSISKTGAYLSEDIISRLAGKINDIELSLDVVPYQPYQLRPAGYHESAAQGMIKLKAFGFYVGAQTVLTKYNISQERIDDLFTWLDKHNIDKWSLLRLFPAGRGNQFKDITPSYEEYCLAVEYIKKISAQSNMLVHFQYLLPGHENYTTNCRAVNRSVGVLHNGNVVACFWDLDEDMSPTDNRYILGKVPHDNIKVILSNKKAQYWLKQDHKCKIFKD